MALSIGFRILSFLPSCYSSYGALNFYPDGTFTHCSCQPSLDAHFSLQIRPALEGKLEWRFHKGGDLPQDEKIVAPSKEYNDHVHKYGIFDDFHENQGSKSLGGAERQFFACVILYTTPRAATR